MPQQIQAVMRKVCPSEGRGEGSSKLQGRFSSRFAPIRSLWPGENPHLTCPVEEFRVIFPQPVLFCSKQESANYYLAGIWTESIAVGSKGFLREITSRNKIRKKTEHSRDRGWFLVRERKPHQVCKDLRFRKRA
jgi:hypothetical protein